MIKLAGSLLLMTSGLLWGLGRSWELLRRERLLTEWQQLIEHLKTGISYCQRPLGELIGGEDSPFCREALKDPAFHRDPPGALGRAGQRILSHPGDKALYKGFTEGLGKSDAPGQLRHLELYAALVAEARRDAREQRDKRGRLDICLGLFGGLTVCLLL